MALHLGRRHALRVNHFTATTTRGSFRLNVGIFTRNEGVLAFR